MVNTTVLQRAALRVLATFCLAVLLSGSTVHGCNVTVTNGCTSYDVCSSFLVNASTDAAAACVTVARSNVLLGPLGAMLASQGGTSSGAPVCKISESECLERTSACQSFARTGATDCPASMRAEFSAVKNRSPAAAMLFRSEMNTTMQNSSVRFGRSARSTLSTIIPAFTQTNS